MLGYAGLQHLEDGPDVEVGYYLGRAWGRGLGTEVACAVVRHAFEDLGLRVPDRVRGTATSAVPTVAYLGFIAGPAYVGAWADAIGLPGAMLAVAALALALATPAAGTVRSRLPSPR